MAIGRSKKMKATEAGEARGAEAPKETAEEAVSREEQLEEELAQLNEKYLHALADQQNASRRALVAEREARVQGAGGVLHGVVTILDHFDVALTQDPEKASAGQVIEGVRLIKEELLRILGEHGVTPLAAEEGAEFNPHEHQAVGHLERDGVEPGRVVATVKPGYMLGDRLLRAALVMVAPPQTENTVDDAAGDTDDSAESADTGDATENEGE